MTSLDPPSATSASLEQAIRLHESGKLDEAAAIYRRVIETEPANADARHLLGLVELARGQIEPAIEHLSRAVQLRPAQALFRAHLGVAYLAAGRNAEAIADLRAALLIDPRAAQTHYELGNALRADRQLPAAEASYRQAIVFDFLLAEAHNALGNVLKEQGKLDGAVAAFQEMARRFPRAGAAQFNLGNCLKASGRAAEAAEAYRRALEIDPDFAPAQHQLGLVLYSTGKFAEAAACHRAVLRQSPEAIESLAALGLALQMMQEREEAGMCFERVLQLNPAHAPAKYYLATVRHIQRRFDEAHALYEQAAAGMADHARLFFHWGDCLQIQGRLAAACNCYERSIAIDPKHPAAHYYLGTARLAQGQFATGWPEYEWRLMSGATGHSLPQPLWDGRPLNGDSILIYAEWGLGDTVQFVRYVPLVQERGGNVTLAVQAPLIPLLKQAGFPNLIPWEAQATVETRWRVPLMSLPRVFGTTFDNIPAQIPYLTARQDLVEKWRGAFERLNGFKVGIHWGGSKHADVDRRSISLRHFEPLARVAGVSLVSLQKNGGQDIDELGGAFAVADPGAEFDEQHGAFMDTAGIMGSLELVITNDSAAAHLAGALGVPVWLALVKGADWRWFEARADSPWYPTMRLFRQNQLDHWPDVFERMAAELSGLAAVRVPS